MQAVVIDGTEIAFDRMRLRRRGIDIEVRKEKSQGSQQSKGNQQSGGSTQSSDQQSTQDDVVVVVDDDVPEEQRDVLEEKLHELEKKEGSSGKQSKQSRSERGSSSGGSGKFKQAGFVPYEKLMYVVPDDVTHRITDLDELPT